MTHFGDSSDYILELFTYVPPCNCTSCPTIPQTKSNLGPIGGLRISLDPPLGVSMEALAVKWFKLWYSLKVAQAGILFVIINEKKYEKVILRARDKS